MHMKTTKISTVLDSIDLEMTGKEYYPIFGDLLKPIDVYELMHQCKGLHPHFNCLEKAMLVREYKKHGKVILGSLLVWNTDMNANFGYFFNLPLEFHAWWQPDDSELGIIDIALPGVIEAGNMTEDDKGPLIEREPLILAGTPPAYTQYNARLIL